MAEIKHGTQHAYVNLKCRCRWCRMANNAYMGAYLQDKRGVTPLRVVGPETLTQRINVDVSDDELAFWNECAEKAGLSRQGWIRRCCNEGGQLELSLERQEEDSRRFLEDAIGG